MGLELDLLSAQLPPIRTTAAAAVLQDYGGGGGSEDAGGTAARHEEVLCITPTAAANVLRAPSVCPPAPRKPRPRPPPAPTKRRKDKKRKNARCSCYCGRRRPPARWTASFVVAVPDDLAKVFVPRRPVAGSMSPPYRPPPDGNKIRVHVVG